MTLDTDCPVCRLEHISDDRDRCPQCDSDLTCFRVLETLLEPEAQTAEPAMPEMNPQMTQTASKRTSLFFVVSGLLLGALTIMLGLQIYWITGLQSGVLEQQSVFSDAAGRMEFRLDRISEHQEKVFMQVTAQIENLGDKLDRAQKSPAVPTAGLADDSDSVPISVDAPEKASHSDGRKLNPPAKANAGSSAFQFYQAAETDTLWGIAKRFYGSGFYYPVLLEHNPDLAIYTIGQKDRIAVLKDSDTAKRIFNEITENQGGILYWYYTVRPEDTLTSVKHKYCPSQDCFQMPTGVDRDFALQPGEKIKIQLSGVLK
jgi:LysM repeat protein